MIDQFTRAAMLYGRDNIEKLKNRRVVVFGIGGVGGHCAEALCRTGVGAIDLFDGDIIDITNINRQIIATHKSIGCNKVDIMRERLLEINPDAVIKAKKLFYLPETANEVDLAAYDYIIDAVDTMTAKLEIICRAAALGVPVISSMGAANKRDPTAFEIADIYETSVCPMARIMRYELRKRGIESLKVVYSKEPPLTPAVDEAVPPCCENIHAADRKRRRRAPASSACVPPVAGLIIASEVIKSLCALA